MDDGHAGGEDSSSQLVTVNGGSFTLTNATVTGYGEVVYTPPIFYFRDAKEVSFRSVAIAGKRERAVES